MNKDKQIEQIQNEIIRWGENADKTGNYNYPLSAHLYNAGYRKESEVAREIFEEIERYIALNSYQGDVFTGRFLSIELEDDIAELKKKYTEEK